MEVAEPASCPSPCEPKNSQCLDNTPCKKSLKFPCRSPTTTALPLGTVTRFGSCRSKRSATDSISMIAFVGSSDGPPPLEPDDCSRRRNRDRTVNPPVSGLTSQLLRRDGDPADGDGTSFPWTLIVVRFSLLPPTAACGGEKWMMGEAGERISSQLVEPTPAEERGSTGLVSRF